MSVALGALAVVAALVGALVGAPGAVAGGCGVAQWACRGGGCVRQDQYCDGAPQCADSSDEPPGCTVCNRTYYGRAGLAYELAVREAPRLPFLCHLTFTASGGAHGDLVQLSWEEFRVGRYVAAAPEPCPDGYMQLAELGRPFTGGSWCGEAAGAALYYSETSTVTVSVKLFRARLGEPFGFRLRYKFLAQRDAVVRFGALEAPLERGSVSPGTYCTRTYEECHKKACKLQSPNYPGMYPRNVTCYWSLRQKDIPTCKHAMISVRQEYSHKMQIKRSISMASLNKTGRAVRAWRECTGERDRLIVYDGPSTDDPVLVVYCGGDWLPRVTSRAADMLVAFHSSPFSAPPRATTPAAPLRGFELDVDVIFADSDSLDYARESRRCEFHVKASSSEEDSNSTSSVGGAGRGRRGVLRAPRHTLPPGTTCTWTFHGQTGDVVWMYFSSFTQYSLVESRKSESGEREDVSTGHSVPATVVSTAASESQPGAAGGCGVEVAVREGGAEVWRGCDGAPALCARAALANETRLPRPCAPPDGYVSKNGVMSLSVRTEAGTATHPLSFSLHYEFVDTRQFGSPWPGAGAVPPECGREVVEGGEWWSPRNVLWFGRGGGRRLRCVWRLRAAGGGAELRLLGAALAGGRCRGRHDARTGAPRCEPTDAGLPEPAPLPAGPLLDQTLLDEMVVPHLWIYDAPWPGFRTPLACICDNSSLVTSWRSGGSLEVELVWGALGRREDHRSVGLRAQWRPLPAVYEPCAVRRRRVPPGEHFKLVHPYDGNEDSECGETPFLLEARENRSVFLRVWGAAIPAAALEPAPSAAPDCHTTSRILIYDAHTSSLLSAVCPSAVEEGPVVQVFSSEWSAGRGVGRGGALLVVWRGGGRGAAALAWAEVWRGGNGSAGCGAWCGAIDACMGAELRCDGAVDCPGGEDEAGGCGAGARLRALLGRGGALPAVAAGAALLLALVVLLWFARRRTAASGKRLALGGSGTRRLTEELLYNSRGSPASLASPAS